MRFEWDEEKSQKNRHKHGLGFETAQLVFDDPNYVLLVDRIDEAGEQRYHAIGGASEWLLLVVHVHRETIDGEEIIRIISARKANEQERRLYLE